MAHDLNPNCSECTWRLGKEEHSTWSDGEDSPWDVLETMINIFIKANRSDLKLKILADTGAEMFVRDIYTLAVEVIQGRMTVAEALHELDYGDDDDEHLQAAVDAFRSGSRGASTGAGAGRTGAMVVNLNQVQDGRDGTWWHHVRAADFGYLDKLLFAELDAFDVDEGDVLIHQEMVEEDGKRYPAVAYSIVSKGSTHVVSTADLKTHLSKLLVRYVQDHNAYPFGCTFVKAFTKNNAVQVTYQPNKFQKFVLKVGNAAGLLRPELPGTPANPHPKASRPVPARPATPAGPAGGTSRPAVKPASPPGETIHKIPASPSVINAARRNGKSSVTIEGAEVVAMKRYEHTISRMSVSQGGEVSENIVYYMLHLANGQVASDPKKSSPREPFEGVLLRLSQSLASGVKVGHRITLNGKLDPDNFWGDVIKNVKKVTRSPVSP